MRPIRSLGLLVIAFALLDGCAVSRTGFGAGGSLLTPLSDSPITIDTLPKHVVIIVQENRSVDNLFQDLPGIDAQRYGLGVNGAHIPLRQIALSSTWDPSHSHSAFVTEFAGGKLNGFQSEPCLKCGTNAAYSYVNPSDVAQYYQMAEQYAFADHNRQPNEGPSWPGHFYLIAAQTGQPGSNWYVSENPSDTSKTMPKNCLAPAGTTIEQIDMTSAYPGTEGNPIFPCLTGTPNILQEIQDAGLTWKYYTPNLGSLWVAPCDISTFDCPNNPNVITPETTILSDIADGTLANVSYVIPRATNSDHPTTPGSNGGPAWVSSVVDAIGQSSYWKDTAIFITWDDWGGWYDHYIDGGNHPASNPNDPYEYGLRVPLIAIGPYARRAYISHTPRDSTSILHFLERNFFLPSLNKLDAQTDDLFELFNFAQTPTAFNPFDPGSMTIQQRRMQPPDPRDVDSD